MKSTRRLLAKLHSHMSMPSSWASDFDTWLRCALEWSDQDMEHFPPPADPVRVVMDQPGKLARHIQIFEGKLLLATLEREPAPTGSKSHSLFSTVKKIRIEWRCRQAGERRILAETLLVSICLQSSIGVRYGMPYIIYAFDPERPVQTTQFLEWPEKHAAVMTRIGRAYAPRQKIVHTTPNICHWADDIAPTVLLSFEP